ncbi:MAG: hypothetical protein ACREMN_07230 [Gemmatimonadales bacterium]
MRNPSLYRIGGAALVAGAVLNAAGVLLHAPQPLNLAAYAAAAASGGWMASHWFLALGATLVVAGLFALTRHLFTTRAEGWAVLGFAATAVTGALFVAVVAPEIAAFPALLQAAGAGSEVAAEHAYLAVNSTLMGLMHVAAPIFWAGTVCYGLALLADAAFPRWLAQAGIAVGVVEIGSFLFVTQNWTVLRLVLLAGFVWLGLVGNSLARVKAPVHV